MSKKEDMPFELEILAEYVKKGDSIAYLTRHDHSAVGEALEEMGLPPEEIREKLSLHRPDEPMEKFFNSVAENIPKKLMVDSFSDYMKMRAHLKKGHISCSIKNRK